MATHEEMESSCVALVIHDGICSAEGAELNCRNCPGYITNHPSSKGCCHRDNGWSHPYAGSGEPDKQATASAMTWLIKNSQCCNIAALIKQGADNIEERGD